jgi:hypothetical protein
LAQVLTVLSLEPKITLHFSAHLISISSAFAQDSPFSTDILEDGVLNNAQLGTTLINNARTLNLAEIRQNLEMKYENMGLTTSVPDFEKYVNQFIENTEFEFNAFIEYPPSGKHGLNLLNPGKTNYTNDTYSMRAILPAGKSLQVQIRGRNWMYPAFQEDTGWLEIIIWPIRCRFLLQHARVIWILK